MPNLVAYDLAGVQPMNGPTGLIFAMRSQVMRISLVLRHLFNEADTAFSGQNEREPLTLVGKTRLLVWEPSTDEEHNPVFLTPLVLHST